MQLRAIDFNLTPLFKNEILKIINEGEDLKVVDFVIHDTWRDQYMVYTFEDGSGDVGSVDDLKQIGLINGNGEFKVFGLAHAFQAEEFLKQGMDM